MKRKLIVLSCLCILTSFYKVSIVMANHVPKIDSVITNAQLREIAKGKTPAIQIAYLNNGKNKEYGRCLRPGLLPCGLSPLRGLNRPGGRLPIPIATADRLFRDCQTARATPAGQPSTAGQPMLERTCANYFLSQRPKIPIVLLKFPAFKC